MAQPTLVTVRFTTARAMLTGCHISGIPYEVTPEFARQVVEREQVAEYVQPESVDTTPDARARKPKRS